MLLGVTKEIVYLFWATNFIDLILSKISRLYNLLSDHRVMYRRYQRVMKESISRLYEIKIAKYDF